MKFCSQCGRQLSGGHSFCGGCGAAVTEPKEMVAKETLPGVLSGTGSKSNVTQTYGYKQGHGSPGGRKRLVIIGSVIALLLVTGGLWGWWIHGAESRVQVKLDLAVKYLSENKFDEAVLTYREVIKIDSKNVPAYKGLSVAYSLQGKNTEAEQALQEGIEKVPDKKPLKLAMAGLMVDTGKADQAAAIYNEVISGDAGYVPAYRAYTKFLVSSGRQAEAVALLEKAAGGGSDYRLHSLLAEARLSAGNQEGAKEAAIKSLSLEINQSAAYRILLDIYSGSPDELASLGDSYLQQGQGKLGYMIKLTGLLAGGKNEDALSLYSQLPGEVKSVARAKLLAASTYLRTGQKDQGLAVLKEIITSDLKDAAMLADIAALYLEAGDKGKAREVATAGIALDDAVVDNYIVLRNSYKGEDNYAAAIWQVKFLVNSLNGVKEAKKEAKKETEKKDTFLAAGTETSSTGAKQASADDRTVFSEADAQILGVRPGDTVETAVAKLGQPANIDRRYAITYKYRFGEVIMTGNKVSYITINVQGTSGPRNIQVGDTKESVVARFPDQGLKEHKQTGGVYMMRYLYGPQDNGQEQKYTGFLMWGEGMDEATFQIYDKGMVTSLQVAFKDGKVQAMFLSINEQGQE